MRALRRRAIGCAAVAATGAVLLVTAIAALAQCGPNQATFRDRVGDGIKTGQMGVQLFNYGGFINNGGGQTGNDQRPPRPRHCRPGRIPDPVRPGRCRRHDRRLPLPIASTCCSTFLRPRASPTSSCSATPASRPRPPTPGPRPLRLPRDARRLRAARRRLARRHERGQLGHPRHRGEDPRRRLHRLRRLPRPGHRQLCRTRWPPPRRSTGSASARSRPASARCTSTTTRRSSRTSTSTTAC